MSSSVSFNNIHALNLKTIEILHKITKSCKRPTFSFKIINECFCAGREPSRFKWTHIREAGIVLPTRRTTAWWGTTTWEAAWGLEQAHAQQAPWRWTWGRLNIYNEGLLIGAYSPFFCVAILEMCKNSSKSYKTPTWLKWGSVLWVKWSLYSTHIFDNIKIHWQFFNVDAVKWKLPQIITFTVSLYYNTWITSIKSNIRYSVLFSLRPTLKWLHTFEILVFSSQLYGCIWT